MSTKELKFTCVICHLEFETSKVYGEHREKHRKADLEKLHKEQAIEGRSFKSPILKKRKKD